MIRGAHTFETDPVDCPKVGRPILAAAAFSGGLPVRGGVRQAGQTPAAAKSWLPHKRYAPTFAGSSFTISVTKALASPKSIRVLSM